jgi:CheY-like chemotaxis protein
VRCAANGEEGLKLAREKIPDAITLDVSMPGMDGWAVLNALKSDPSLKDVPVIMMSVMDEKDRGFAFGAADYLKKPIDWEQLGGVLKKHFVASKHVLIVDDDATSRQMLRRTLEKAGWSVEEAENGKVAIEKIEESRPALILLDLMMPEVSGFDVVTRLQQDPELRTIPVVVITAKDLTEADRQHLTDGVQQVYQKGAYSRDEFLAQVKDLVSSMNREPPASSS